MLRRLRYWTESAGRSEALREEMELHLAERAAELEADGMTPEGARAEARRRFGNVGLKHEESREIWMTRFLSELGQDIRYGCRTMVANKAFSALAVLTLALGIGANTTIYSFMESILLRSLPVADPESLVVLNWHSRPPRDGGKESVHVMHGRLIDAQDDRPGAAPVAVISFDQPGALWGTVECDRATSFLY